MMCHRSQPRNGADSVIQLGPITEPDTAAVLAAYNRCTAALAAQDVAAVVYELRALQDHPDAHDLLAAMLDADPEPRGQALVEFALVTPLLLLLIVGGMMLGLAMHDRSTLTHAAQEAARAAAEAPSDPERCDAARAAIETVSGRSFGSCPDPERFSVSYVEGEPRGVRVTIEGGTYPVPFMDSVTVAGRAGALIRSPEPSPSEEPTP